MIPAITITKIYSLVAGLALIAVSAPAVAQTGSSSQDMAAANFRMADSNADGALSAEEFVVFINLNAAQNIGQANRVKSAGAYGRAFSSIDKNQDGRVTPDEVASSAN